MEPVLLLTIFVSFFCTLFTIPFWIKKAKEQGFVGIDMNKPKKNYIAEVGGVSVLIGVSIGILMYVAINTFYFHQVVILPKVFAILSVLFLSAIIGLLDDLLGWKKGLSKRMRIFFILIAAIPLMAINAGVHTMAGIEFGWIYSLVLIPIGVVGATTTFNFLAGYNGLEASQGILILSALAIVTFLTGNSWLSIIALCMVASLFAFYIFNKYPAKLFPGDSLTYPVGALIASIAILGNIEKIAVFFFIPYLLETILKLRGKLNIKKFMV